MTTPYIYNLQAPVKTRLSIFSEAFDGLPGISKLVPPDDLYRLISYPGTVAIVKPWGKPIDLKPFGIQKGHWLNVLDSNRKLIYKRYVNESAVGDYTDSWFGSVIDDKDKNLLMNSPNGRFIYLSFVGIRDRYSVLVWICNELSDSMKRLIIDRYKQEIAITRTTYPDKLISLNLQGSLATYHPSMYDVIVSYYSQRWILPPTVSFMQNSEEVSRRVEKLSMTISINLSDGWYHLYLINKTTGVKTGLRTINISGIGEQLVRYFPTNTQIFYAQLNSVSVGQARISGLSDFRSNVTSYTRINLQGNLAI